MLLLLALTPVNAEQNQTHEYTQKQLDKKSYQEIKKELDYSKTKRALRLKKEKFDLDPDVEKPKPKKTRNYGLGGLANILAYAAIICLISVLVYLIFSNIKIDKKLDTALEDAKDEEEIENLDELDIASKYQAALLRGDYRSAIRWQFLQALQLLSQKEIIFWKPDKTNRDYNREIKNINLKNQFRQIAAFYERVWYGNNTIDHSTFEMLNVHFDNFIKQQDVK